jgi:outer membrane protein assembly factor BamB
VGLFVYSSPAVANGIVYVGSDDQSVYALNASTGAELWSYATSGAVRAFGSRNFVNGSPALASGVLYFGSGDGNVYALGAGSSGGSLLWEGPTGSDVQSSPAVANGQVFIGSEDHNVYAYDLSTPPSAAKRPAPSQLHPSYRLPVTRS